MTATNLSLNYISLLMRKQSFRLSTSFYCQKDWGLIAFVSRRNYGRIKFARFFQFKMHLTSNEYKLP